MSRGFIPPSFIDDLVARVDIVDIINLRVPLKRAGNSHKACCPFHQEKTPSFMVSQTKQIYHCFGCGVKGTVINFIMDYERLDFVEAIEYLAQHEGMVIPYEKNHAHDGRTLAKVNGLLDWLALAGEYFQHQLRHHQDKTRAVDYLKQRGLSGQDALGFNIGFAPEGWNGLLTYLKAKGATEAQLVEAGLVVASDNNHHYDRFRDRIMFPIRNRKGETIGFGGRILDQGEPKYLNSPESPVFFKGKELYGLYELRKNTRSYNEIIVVEGYMDVVMLAHYGIYNVVATLGTATSSKQIEVLFRQTHRIVFCFDGDEAGKNAAYKAMISALPVLASGKELGFLFLPHNDDPDSFVKAQGKAAFEAKVQQALPLSDYLFDTFEKKYDPQAIEGRSAILEEMGALINQMPDTPFRDLIRSEFARRLDLKGAVLNRHVQAGKMPTIGHPRELGQGKNLVERALILLLNDLSLVQGLSGCEFLLESRQKNAAQLYQVITTLLDYPNIKTTAQVLLFFNNEPWITWLERLSFREPTLEGALCLAEFKDLLAQLAKQSNPRKQALLKLTQGLELTDEEALLLK